MEIATEKTESIAEMPTPTNIAAPDALQLATAIFAKCDILVTNDDDFLGIVKQNKANIGMLATKADKFDNALNEYAKQSGVKL